MDFADLTDRQKSVLAYIIDFHRQHGMAPTVREIGAHLGLRSPGGIHRILNILKDRGYILAEPGKKRSWRFGGNVPGTGIPLVGAIAAGRPLAAIEHLEEELAISPSVFGCDRCFGLRVSGDSMIDAGIMEGDIAIIRPQNRVANGRIAAVLVEDLIAEATLKIVHLTPKSMTLKSANQAYRPLVFRGSARRRVSIVGKYVGIVRKA